MRLRYNLENNSRMFSKLKQSALAGEQMTELDQGSLQYFSAHACDPQWRSFLGALASELNAQMPPEELRAFYYVVGRRMADQSPLQPGDSLNELEGKLNAVFSGMQWGWCKVRDLGSSLEFAHSCSPLRAAFGDASMEWCGALLEGMYATWLRQLGASADLLLRQVGSAEGPTDTLRFRLAHPSLFL